MNRAVPGWRWRPAAGLQGDVAGPDAIVADPGGRAPESDATRG